MSARKQYRTKAGVLVESRGSVAEFDRCGRIAWKVAAFRVSTGGFFGWLWLKNLREVKRRAAKGGKR